MKIGYVRVSTEEQNIERQEIILRKLGAQKIYIDKLSGKNRDRPMLQTMLEFVREGDCVVVESISRLARNTKDLLDIVDFLKKKEVGLIIQKEAVDTSTAVGMCVLTIFGAIAQLERDYLLQRQREGIDLAKNKGKYKGRKPNQLDEEKWNKYYVKWKNKEIKAVEFREYMNMPHNSFYRKVRQLEEKTI